MWITFLNLQENVETCGFEKLAGYKINLPFKTEISQKRLTNKK